jgi:polyhydroxybutyrate depolymerase
MKISKESANKKFVKMSSINTKHKRLITTLAEMFILFGCIFPAAAANDHVTPKTITMHILVNGTDRKFLVHLPSSYNESEDWPVIFIFHGGGGTASGIMKETGWAKKADEEGFIAVFPEGSSPDPSKRTSFLKNPQTWNDGSYRSNLSTASDVTFVSEILADLKTKYNVDGKRIYATGFSNGASMTFRLARELSQDFAAVAPVSGADWLPDTVPARPVPILYITGTADPLNPMEGGNISLGKKSLGGKPPVLEIVDNWSELHGYTENSIASYQNEIAEIIICGSKEDPGVVLYAIKGHGHHWPGGNSVLPKIIAGPNTATINATDIIWEYFKQQTRPENP